MLSSVCCAKENNMSEYVALSSVGFIFWMFVNKQELIKKPK
tara:strand:+ start:1985 stop:2107 length:123 start_codon:yes stop_codon:yes gene_type:complete